MPFTHNSKTTIPGGGTSGVVTDLVQCSPQDRRAIAQRLMGNNYNADGFAPVPECRSAAGVALNVTEELRVSVMVGVSSLLVCENVTGEPSGALVALGVSRGRASQHQLYDSEQARAAGDSLIREGATDLTLVMELSTGVLLTGEQARALGWHLLRAAAVADGLAAAEHNAA